MKPVTMRAAVLLLTASAAAQSQEDKDAAALRSFQAGVAQFLELHHRLESSIVAPAQPADAMTLCAVADALRDQLKRARVGTTEGKLFTPLAARVFRRIIAQTVHGDRLLPQRLCE